MKGNCSCIRRRVHTFACVLGKSRQMCPKNERSIRRLLSPLTPPHPTPPQGERGRWIVGERAAMTPHRPTQPNLTKPQKVARNTCLLGFNPTVGEEVGRREM